MLNRNSNPKKLKNSKDQNIIKVNDLQVDFQEQKMIQRENDGIFHQSQNKGNKELSGLQQIIIIVSLSIFIMFLITFISIAVYQVFFNGHQPQQNVSIMDLQTPQNKKLNISGLSKQEIKSNPQGLTKIKQLENQLMFQKQQIRMLNQTIKNVLPKIQEIYQNQKRINQDTTNQRTQKFQTKKKEQQTNTSHKLVYQNNEIKFKIREKRKSMPPNIQKGDRYQFTLSIDKVVEISDLKKTYTTQSITWSGGIKKSEYQRAIRLMQVVHNINYNGEFVLDNFNFYPTPQAKVQALFKILQEEKKFLDQKYSISKYIQDQIGMCVYVPSYNNARKRLYMRNLDSIFQQEYQNYHVVYVNDASTDGTGDYVQAYMQENLIPTEKYTIINNEKNKGNCANIYNIGHNYCKEGEIMVLLDGDDALVGRQVFALLNAVYQKEKLGLVYGQLLVVTQNVVSNGYSKFIPQNNLNNGTFRSLKTFYTTHLKTMYVDLFRKIDQKNLQYDNGTFFESASDVAFMTPAIELAGTRLRFLPQIIYQYRFDTGQNIPHFQQRVIQNIIFQKPPLKKLQNMSFADNPKTIHYSKEQLVLQK